MSLLLKNCLVVDPGSVYHHKKCNLLVDNGVIASIDCGDVIATHELIDKIVTPGWFDLNAHFNDPGTEVKEDIRSGSEAALNGGFTDVQITPNTSPSLQSKTDIKYINGSSIAELSLHVSAALSEELKGENITEILDLHAAGAVSVSDGDNPIWNPELLLKALQYTSGLSLPVFQNPRDIHLSRNTQMHEGLHSTNLGLRGESKISEILTVKRDLDLLRYAGGHLHFTKISVKESVNLIREAREQGLNVTADVALPNLIYTDESVGIFDNNFKVLPPYRSAADRDALIAGVRSGVIDAICSNHRPQDLESKQLEFDLSEPGVITLQTFYPMLLGLIKEIPFDILVERITSGPRKVLSIPKVEIEEGMEAKLTILDSTEEWILDEQTNLSKSKNTPLFGEPLKGKVVGVVNGIHHKFFD